MEEKEKTFMSASKAARILTCSVERLHELCDQGLIYRQCEGDNVFVRTSDVMELKRLDIIGEIKPGEMIKRLLMMETTVSRLESTLNMLLEVNEIASSRFSEMSN